jgi:DnaJ-class molecular chaperone
MAAPQFPPKSSHAEDPYATLGLTRSASAADIKKAYRRLVRLSHPDINPDDPGAEERFVRITAAHDLLKDPASRARFDAGEIDAAGQEKPQRRYYRDYAEAEAPRPSAEGFAGMDPDAIFAEIFRQRGGGAGGRGFAARGQDHAYRLEVPFLDAARGGSARITLPGEGPMEVRIPVGLRDGQTLRLRGKGGEGQGGGPRGDAQVTVAVQPHPLFRREGETILITLPITLDEAVLGAKIDVPTIHGDVSLSIPKGSGSGKVLRLRGRGVQGGAGAGRTRTGSAGAAAAGDQLVELRITVPKAPDAKLTAFMEEWQKTRHDDPRKAMMEGMPR